MSREQPLVLTKVKPWFKLYLERKDRKMKNERSVTITAGGGGEP